MFLFISIFVGLKTREEDIKSFDEISENEFSELGFNLAACRANMEVTNSGTLPPVSLSPGEI